MSRGFRASYIAIFRMSSIIFQVIPEIQGSSATIEYLSLVNEDINRTRVVGAFRPPFARKHRSHHYYLGDQGIPLASSEQM